jgi:hypothetical protein
MSYFKFPYDTIIAMGYHKHTYGTMDISIMDTIIYHNSISISGLFPVKHYSAFWFTDSIYTLEEKLYIKNIILYLIKNNCLGWELKTILNKI